MRPTRETPAGKRLARHPAPARDAAGSGPVLVVAAFEPELGPVREACRRQAHLRTGVVALSVGIGPVDAAAGTARVLAQIDLAPRALFFVGTAGSYGAAPAVGRPAVARRIALASAAVARGEGYRPAAMPSEIATDAGLRRDLQRIRLPGGATPLADVATPTAITVSPALARRLAASTRTQVENLELYAVARAAAAAGVPFAAVVGIANRVGPGAHQQWRRNADRATQAASTVLLALLERMLAPTAPIKAPSRPSTRRPRRRRSSPLRRRAGTAG